MWKMIIQKSKSMFKFIKKLVESLSENVEDEGDTPCWRQRCQEGWLWIQQSGWRAFERRKVYKGIGKNSDTGNCYMLIEERDGAKEWSKSKWKCPNCQTETEKDENQQISIIQYIIEHSGIETTATDGADKMEGGDKGKRVTCYQRYMCLPWWKHGTIDTTQKLRLQVKS